MMWDFEGNQSGLNREAEDEARSERRDWILDEFEIGLKNKVPAHKALEVYRPKIKKPSRMRRLLKSPLFAGILSSVLSCAVAFGVFAYGVKPQLERRLIMGDSAPSRA